MYSIALPCVHLQIGKPAQAMTPAVRCCNKGAAGRLIAFPAALHQVCSHSVKARGKMCTNVTMTLNQGLCTKHK